MPNHCSNILTIKGKDVSKFKKNCIVPNAEKDAWDKLKFDFNAIVPCPKGINYDLEWYKSEWGTKNGAYDLEITTDTPTKLVLYFNTAWSPANEKFVEAMAEQYDLDFMWHYYEPGEGFAGYYDVVKGEVISHYYKSEEEEYKDVANDVFNADVVESEEEGA